MVAVFRATPDRLDLARTALEELHDRPVDDAALAAFLDDKSCYQFVAVEDGRVVGGLNGYRLPNPGTLKPQFFLYEIDVRKEARRRGIGRSLVAAFTGAACDAGACEVWVAAEAWNTAARALYAGSEYTVESEHAIVFARIFDPNAAGPRSEP